MTQVIDKELVEELKATFEGQLKPLNDRLDEEKKARGEVAGETKAAVEKVQDRLDQLEASWKQAAIDAARETKGDSSPAEREVRERFLEACRKGLDALGPDERKSLSVADDTQAGFLAPSEFMREVLKGVIEWSPMRDLVRVVSTSASSIKWPKRTGTMAARWVGETETRTETTGTKVGIEEIPTHELHAMVDVSLDLLEDAVFDLESYLSEEAAEQFGVAEGTAFVTGTGAKQPEGILAVGSGIDATLETAASNVLAGDDLIKLFFSLKGAYARNAAWVMNRATIRDVRLLKESVSGNYLWQPGLAGLGPATLLDRPYFEAPDMPLVTTDNAKIIAFGDFRRGYIAVDRIVMTAQRDPYTQADEGMVRFRFRRRQGGQTVIPEAIKILTAKA